MTPPAPIRVIPRVEDDDDDDDGIIENISALILPSPEGDDAAVIDGRPHVPENADHDDDEDVSSAVLSLSSATSATSAASALSDGAPPSEERDASSERIVQSPEHEFADDTTPQAGQHAQEQRWQTSEVESQDGHSREAREPVGDPDRVGGGGGGGGAIVGAETVARDATSPTSTGADDAAAIRNIFHTRRHRSRAGSIPEEEEMAPPPEESIEVATTTTDQRGDGVRIEQQQQRTAAPRAGRLLARAAANATSLRPSDPTRSARRTPLGPSAKQRPSHRKLRRWDNDRFVGTSSEQIHVALERGGFDGDVMDGYWSEFYTVDYPREHRSEFARLSGDGSGRVRNARERFLKGEVARGNCGGNKDEEGRGMSGGMTWMERGALAKFRRMGLTAPSRTVSSNREEGNSDGETLLGKELFRKLGPRIRSVLSRSCAMRDDGESLARRSVAAFESYLVSLALTASSSEKASGVVEGYPPRQPQSTYDLFERMFSSPPRVVVRDRGERCGATEHLHAALVPTVHFYFATEDDDGRGAARSSSSAFHRILLYAVCGFHGMEASSSVLDPRKGKRRGGGRKGEPAMGGVVKAVTVQGGVLLAPSLRLLDYLE
eukprot:CAMPEP_0181111452 /NCGR_PEP_ID=MMETSP1071-20121207/19281_1 /TAXON_ID=35127 /ORGANISM="Thalassiosira sp., Strain NH16" /LENGTH=605 /DNA_ID=CAMNT_0023195343 /DNA_START=195 /DNA_END=2012 /DNA_ORIENTATION=-